MAMQPIGEPTSAPSGATRAWRWLVLAVAVLLIGAIAAGIWQRARASAALARASDQESIAVVDVVHPAARASGGELVLPGTAQAYRDTPVYARTSGYIKSWRFDIGAHVHRGQLLALIDAPEVDKQLLQSRANLATAQANLNLADITAARDERLLRTNAISTQERDNAVAAAAADQAIVQAGRADVARLEQLQSFERVEAPFDGVITARNTDVGDLIDAGAASSKELFHIGSTQTLRVFVSIPEIWSPIARPGLHASLTLAEFPDRAFPCTLVRTAGAIDVSARTLLAEFDVDNHAGQLLPGAYVQLHIRVPSSTALLMIPSNTLLFRSEGIRVGLVRDGRTRLVPVQIGRDYGSTVEVLAGLHADDLVILDPSDSMIDGVPVRIHAVRDGP